MGRSLLACDVGGSERDGQGEHGSGTAEAVVVTVTHVTGRYCCSFSSFSSSYFSYP